MGRSAYAILLDVTDRQAVLVGGGAVAARKAAGLLEAGARRVRVVAPVICEQMPRGVERIESKYRAEHLGDAELVFAATNDPAVNAAVVADARRIGAWVSRIDDAGDDHGDFTRPAVWTEGNVSVAVSTGCAPALARRIRDAIGEWIDPRWVAMAGAMERVRPIINDPRAGFSPERRRTIFRSLVSEEALAMAGDEGTEGVLRWMAERYPEIKLPKSC